LKRVNLRRMILLAHRRNIGLSGMGNPSVTTVTTLDGMKLALIMGEKGGPSMAAAEAEEEEEVVVDLEEAIEAEGTDAKTILAEEIDLVEQMLGRVDMACGGRWGQGV